jgi:hypothetical protein
MAILLQRLREVRIMSGELDLLPTYEPFAASSSMTTTWTCEPTDKLRESDRPEETTAAHLIGERMQMRRTSRSAVSLR